MRSASITQAKNGLSALIDRVRAGETVVILDRGMPVARLEPITHDGNSVGRLERLERAGIIRRGISAPDVDAIATPGPETKGGASGVEAVIAERRSGR